RGALRGGVGGIPTRVATSRTARPAATADPARPGISAREPEQVGRSLHRDPGDGSRSREDARRTREGVAVTEPTVEQASGTRAASISRIVPEGVAAAELFSDPPGLKPHPQEEPLVARAVEKRRREFAGARHCARQAMQR